MCAKYVLSHNYAYVQNPGGVSDMANNLAAALRARSHDVAEVFPHTGVFKGRTIRRFVSEIFLSLRYYSSQVVILFPNYFAVPLPGSRAKSVVVIHDLQFKYYPGFHSMLKRLTLEFSYQLARRADGIVFISEGSRNDFIKFYGRPRRSKVILTPIDVSETRETHDKVSNETHSPYAIANFHSYPHKNMEKVFEVFRNVQLVIPQLKLIVTGRQPKRDDLISKFNLAPDSVIFTGFIEKQQVLRLIAGSDFFISMSLFEGFNMSAAEAAKLGRPLLLSDIPVHRELFGDYAFLSKPDAETFETKKFMAYLSDFSAATKWKFAEETEPDVAADHYLQFFDEILDREAVRS